MTREDINDIINAICPNDEDYEKPCISPKYLRQELEQLALDQRQWNGDPTTKNDLGVDCISREQALVAIRNLYPGMPRVDFNGSLRKWVDKYKPYIECDDAIKQLPTVTPQTRKGHWINKQHLLSSCSAECSSCHKRSNGYVHDNGFSLECKYYDFCPNCGCAMVELQESEET